jgi:ABC-type multidrug transport system fused ATPase/permease subunit
LDFALHLPGGLDTLVGEQGLGLSRGQAQRVALARAFLKDAPILLLDEPTSGLDSKNERLVMSALEKLSSGRTVLMLTHRLANIEKADRIMVLEEGRIVEQGTYAELIEAGGVFQRLAQPDK